MIHKTTGIILHTTKYSETSLIIKAYTRQFGLQSYIINDV
ncbi:MAG: DNA repair protein RecO, partial [Bacteroidota bacterium]